MRGFTPSFTGGGWQDQVGGILPGAKLIQTAPGPFQVPSVLWTVFDMAPGSELGERILLYYTGLTRMARGILQKVVTRYLARDPGTLLALEELKETALRMKVELDGRDTDAFARSVEEYWTLKKRIDPGTTNEPIEAMLKRIDRWTAGRTLAGAGGGGFLFLVAKDGRCAQKIRAELTRRPPNPLARFYDMQVDNVGLKVSVL